MEDFAARRAAAIAEAEPGLPAARRLCAMTDEAVRELSLAASSHAPGRFAVLALGGWGAGALLPDSDLDILVLSDASAEKLKPFVEALLYPLWDAGLAVGHQVRSPKQQLRAVREDLKACTAGLTARPLAGDLEWAAASIASWLGDAHARARRLLPELARRERPGSPYLLQPDLKNGAGGRRDYDELVWSAAVATGTRAADAGPLADADILGGDEHSRLMRTVEVVAAARFAIQRAGFGDRLTLDALDALADAGIDAEEVQAALGETALALDRVRARLRGGPSLRGTAGRPDAGLDPALIFALLDSGASATAELERLAQAGALDALLPRMRELMSCRRPGLGHELTVGAHSLKAASLIASFGTHGGPLASSHAALTAADTRLVQVTALAHDAAKLDGGAGHAERGAALAEETARRFGLHDPGPARASELTRHHLLLAQTALHVDLDAEDDILRCADILGDAGLLAPLHLLTAADSMATGPATWSPWTAARIGTLVSRLSAALADDVDGAGIASRGESVRRAVLESMADAASAERAFVATAPLRYLASREPAEVATHASLVGELAGSRHSDLARIAVGAGPVTGTHRLTIAAADTPQLLARLAGAIALAGLDILSVDAYGAPGGIALDGFVVASATRRAVTTSTFSAVERLVRAALMDRLELATRLNERRRHYPPKSGASVRVETAPIGWDTAVRVTAPDRPGLLYDIALAVSAVDLDIRWARITTIDGVARDIFHVTGRDGSVVDDPGVLGHLAMRIREAV